MDIWPGRLSGYEFLTVIGSGGQACVYRARQRAVANRTVVVKIYHRPLAGRRDHRRFEREVRAAAALSGHRHVVQIHDAGLLDTGQPYIAMEYCPGGSLAEQLRDGGPLPHEMVTCVGVKIASALAAAHRARVLHRDVKPANILLAAGGVPVLADFGIAAITVPHADISATLGVLTLGYAAPELMRGMLPTPASDLFSLGATLYALLSGRPPRFPAGRTPSLAEIVRLHEQPVDGVPGVPEPLMAILRRAMDANAAARQGSIAQFLNDLVNFRRTWRAFDAGRSRVAGTPPARMTGRPRRGFKHSLIAATQSMPRNRRR